MEKSIILNRTSTKDQNPGLQLKECKEYNTAQNWDLIKVFEKQVSAYKEDNIWKEEIQFAVQNQVKHIIVWNMDRFSRRPEEEVLDQTKLLALMHNIRIHAVHGDAWSQVVDTIGNLQSLGFIGKALAEFLETLIKGLEHRRAYRESEVKSERVKMAVRKKGEKTISYKGNKWGRKSLSTQKKNQIKALRASGKTIREIGIELNISRGVVHKYIAETPIEKSEGKEVP